MRGPYLPYNSTRKLCLSDARARSFCSTGHDKLSAADDSIDGVLAKCNILDDV